MRRILPLVVLLLLATGLTDAAAQGCPAGARCRTVTVPLDRSGAVAGTIALAVARSGATRPRRAPVLVLTGGPGQPARESIRGFAADLGERLVRERGLIAFDMRGTGRSQAIDCPELQGGEVPRDTAAAEACAARLGSSRGAYTVRDQVADLEAVRAALKVPRLALYGISYGTKVAQVYARLHPARVERLVLDSAVPAGGADALSQEVLGAMPRVLGERRVDELAAFNDRLRASPVSGRAFDARGRARPRSADPAAIFDVLLAGDFNPLLRQALPSALRSLEAGDPAPLLRLVHAAREQESPPARARDFSLGMYAAASCEEITFPWPAGAAPEERRDRALAALRGGRVTRPFSPEDVLGLDWLSLCLRWPQTGGTPPPLPATPDLPALVLSGEADLRTPLEDAQRVVSAFPRGRLLRVPGLGHSVAGTEPSGCAVRAIRAFLGLRRPASRCPRARTGYERGIPVAPRGLPGRGDRVARTLRAVDLTIEDAFVALALGVTGMRAGGLRGGTARFDGDTLSLRRYEYVPGLRVSLRGARLTVTGTAGANGTVRIDGTRVRGRLGGRRVDRRLPRR